jgi:hypothetical protein
MSVLGKTFRVAGPFASVMVGCIATSASGGQIDVANSSFETPTVAPNPALLFAPPWTMNGGGTIFEPGGPGTGTVAAGVGIFTNPSVGNEGHLENATGAQLAFLFNNNGNSISQGLVDPGNTNQATTFQAGQSYTLTSGLANAGAAPSPGSKLTIDLYWVDGLGAQHNVAERIVDPSELNQASVIDLSTTPTALLSAGDPAVGKQVFIGYFASGTGGGEFDLDNVRLTSVPEPGAIGIPSLAAASLVGHRRIRRGKRAEPRNE